MASKYTLATLCVAARPPMDVQIRDVSRSGLGIIRAVSRNGWKRVVVVCGGLTITVTCAIARSGPGEYTAGICITKS